MPRHSPPSRSPVRVELAAQLALAIPLAAAQLGQHLMGLVDSIVLGHWDEVALGGAVIANGLLFTLTVVGMGVVMGLDTLVPQAFGAGEPGRARALLGRGLRVAVAVGLPLTLIAGLSPQILPLAGVDPDVAYEAEVYVYGRLPGIIPFLLVTAFRSYLQAGGFTRPIVLAMVIGNIVNLGADLVLVFGDRGLESVGLPAIGLPPLGGLGVALTTSIVTLGSVAITGLAARAVDAPRREVSRAESRAMTTEVVRLGAPVGLQLLVEVGIFALTSTLAGYLGKLPAAAHGIAIALASFTFSLAVGLGAAASVRVGRAVGARDGGARRAGLVSLGLTCAAMAVPAFAFAVFPAQLARLFTSDPEVIEAAVPLLRIAALFQITDGLQAACAGALRGAGDTRWTLYGNVIGHYGVGVAVMFGVTFGLGAGAPGLWFGLCAGLSATAAVLITRFLRITVPIRRGHNAP